MDRTNNEFRGMHHRLEPDFSRPLLEVSKGAIRRMRDRLEMLYGENQEKDVWHELERILKVHQAHATAEILAAERAFEPAERFTEKDIVLITYGDLILSDNRSPLKTLADFAEVFFRGIITTLHILPFYPYSSDRGFSVISFEEVDPHLGSWEDVAELEASFKLMFDGVFNHVSSKSYWFQQFLAGNPEYQDFFTVFSSKSAVSEDYLKLILRPRTSSVMTEFLTIDGPRWVWTTFSEDQVDLNFKNPKVLLKIIEILLYYVRRGADLLRLDAITYLWCELGTNCAHLEETHQVVKLFRDVLDAVAPHVALITETNVPHEDNVTYFGDGVDEAQMVYNFALPPIVLHTFQTANSKALSAWASTLEPPAVTTGFFNFLDSHDGIGVMGARGILSEEEIEAMCAKVREHGGFVSMKSDSDGAESPYELNITWFSALNKEDNGESVDLQVARFIASRAVALVLRGVPGIYLPSIFGSRNDIEAVFRENSWRSINRSAIDERQLFEKLGVADSIPARIARRYVDLLEHRVSEPAFHPAAEQQVLDLDPRVFTVVRKPMNGGSPILCLINVSVEEVHISLSFEEAQLRVGPLECRVGELVPHIDGEHFEVFLPPYAVCWLKESY